MLIMLKKNGYCFVIVTKFVIFMIWILILYIHIY